MLVEAPESPQTITTLPPVPVNGEWVRAPETEPFKNADEAALWLRVATSELYGKNRVEGVQVHFKETNGGWIDAPTVADFTLYTRDDLDNAYSIRGEELTDHEGNYGLSTSIDFTTKSPGPGIKPFTTGVSREDSFVSHPSVPVTDGSRVVYSVTRHNYDVNNGSLKQTLTRTKPGELSKKETREAEKQYLELAREFREALESKLARVAPARLDAIQAAHAEQVTALEARKRAADAGFLGKLGLRRKLRSRRNLQR